MATSLQTQYNQDDREFKPTVSVEFKIFSLSHHFPSPPFSSNFYDSTGGGNFGGKLLIWSVDYSQFGDPQLHFDFYDSFEEPGTLL